MDQDATWYGGKARPRRHCVRWGHSSRLPRKKGKPPSFQSMSVVAKRLDGLKTPLGTEVELGPAHIVLDLDPAAPVKGAQQPPPSFQPMSIVAMVAHLNYC